MKSAYVRTKYQPLCEQKFTRYCCVQYSPAGCNENSTWELVQRTTRDPGVDYGRSPVPFSIDAVEICATVFQGCEKMLILVAQYRPPTDCIVLEFPSGLVDKGEDAVSAALRELREETGYEASKADVIHVSPPICPEPGLIDSCSVFVKILIDSEFAENMSPKQHLEEGEDIEVVLLSCSSPLENAIKFVERKKKQGVRCILDAKLYTFLNALSQ